MDLGISMGVFGALVLVAGAVVIAIGTQLVGEVKFGLEWALVGIAALAGGFVASEWIVGLRTFEPVFDGLALVPALIGGLAAGIAVDAVTRYGTHGSYLGHAA
jgi:hypothetical protein